MKRACTLAGGRGLTREPRGAVTVMGRVEPSFAGTVTRVFTTWRMAV